MTVLLFQSSTCQNGLNRILHVFCIILSSGTKLLQILAISVLEIWVYIRKCCSPVSSSQVHIFENPVILFVKVSFFIKSMFCVFTIDSFVCQLAVSCSHYVRTVQGETIPLCKKYSNNHYIEWHALKFIAIL